MGAEQPDIKEIFCTALEKKSRAERDAYLDEVCGPDKKLRADIETLLKAHDAAGSFLESPPVSIGGTLDYSPLTEGPGTKIGRYKLLQLIGEGGFGVVYMAEQEEPIHRKVALKIIKLGMDTKQVIARFEAERQALAMMDHPDIARVFDAGATDTGRPYFVMELVKGIPITEYCDKNNLDMHQRLELFIDVCKAIQHAHQKGIIHRDIKPSNVMVTLHDGKPVPKIIDFGIAKATQHRLTEKTLFTEYRQFIGTPEYMSPEQAEMSGLDVDTRSDIYSLGVLLYELVTGTTPFEADKLRSAAYDEIRRIIREDEPSRPSTRLSTLGEALMDIAKCRSAQPNELCKIVRGDLDWVVMKSLEKDRTRRYETVDGFALDIERHLKDEPVLAGPPRVIYRLRKFIRRHKTAVATCLLFATVIVAGLVVSTTMYFRAEALRVEAEKARQRETAARVQAEQSLQREADARAEAERQANISQAVNEFLNNDLLASFDPYRAKGGEVTVTEILDNATEKLEGKFKDAPLIEASIHYTLGTTYTNLSKFKAAQPHLERAFELRRGLLGEEHPQTLDTMQWLGALYYRQGRYVEAEPLLIKAMEILKRTRGEENQDTLLAIRHIGELYCLEKRYGDAEPLFLKVLETQRRMLGEENPDPLDCMEWLGVMYYNQGRYKDAEPLLVKSLELSRRAWGEVHPTTLMSIRHLGELYCLQGRYNEAEPLLVKALVGMRNALGEKHQHTQEALSYLTSLLEHLGSQGIQQYNAGKFEDAVVTLERVDEDRRIVLKNESHPCEIAYISMALHQLGRDEEAKAALEKLRDLLKDERFAKDENAKAYLAGAEKMISGEKQ
jgi:serine/threonine protein kinase/tetratricopeptide (TPR) repeat protein